MQGFYTPRQLAEKIGGGESTYRLRAERGDYVHAFKQGGTWFISMLDVNQHGRGYNEEFAEPQKLSPDYSNDPSDIVIAKNDDRYGIYISGHWYGARQALNILAYLTQHRAWLEEKSVENDANAAHARTKDRLVSYARQIAIYRGYPDLVNGLQPLERLREKYAHEIEEFKEALASKSWLHQLHEASDVIYYAACADEQADSPESDLYSAALRECAQLIRFHGTPVTDKQIEAAARAKYGWRAAEADNKNEAHELVLIEQAVSE